eukprot:14751562-Heterocapsa_arctica.AAC.1
MAASNIDMASAFIWICIRATERGGTHLRHDTIVELEETTTWSLLPLLRHRQRLSEHEQRSTRRCGRSVCQRE